MYTDVHFAGRPTQPFDARHSHNNVRAEIELLGPGHVSFIPNAVGAKSVSRLLLLPPNNNYCKTAEKTVVMNPPTGQVLSWDHRKQVTSMGHLTAMRHLECGRGMDNGKSANQKL